MTSITVYMKDNSVIGFPHQGRAGGSYENSIKYVEGFVVIKDEWDNETCIPTWDIKKIEIERPRRY